MTAKDILLINVVPSIIAGVIFFINRLIIKDEKVNLLDSLGLIIGLVAGYMILPWVKINSFLQLPNEKSGLIWLIWGMVSAFILILIFIKSKKLTSIALYFLMALILYLILQSYKSYFLELKTHIIIMYLVYCVFVYLIILFNKAIIFGTLKSNPNSILTYLIINSILFVILNVIAYKSLKNAQILSIITGICIALLANKILFKEKSKIGYSFIFIYSIWITSISVNTFFTPQKQFYSLIALILMSPYPLFFINNHKYKNNNKFRNLLLFGSSIIILLFSIISSRYFG